MAHQDMTLSMQICDCHKWMLIFPTILIAYGIVKLLHNMSDIKGRLHFIFSFLLKTMSLLVLSFFIFLVVVAVSPSLLQRLFVFNMTNVVTYNAHMDSTRCGALSGVSGRVLELGPGPGSNFRCWGGNETKITEWVGVEPVSLFADVQSEEKRKYGIKFSTRSVWMKGENLDVDSASFDAVVGTHLLCSVDDPVVVFEQIERALKPGGSYFFLEHTLAPHNNYFVRFAQLLVSPILRIFGNGCRQRETLKYFTSNQTVSNFDVSLEIFDAPIHMTMRPHIKGIATKKQ